MHDEGENEALLEDGIRQYFLLDADLEFDSPGMGLGPDERGIDESDLLEWSCDLFQTDSWDMIVSYGNLNGKAAPGEADSGPRPVRSSAYIAIPSIQAEPPPKPEVDSETSRSPDRNSVSTP